MRSFVAIFVILFVVYCVAEAQDTSCGLLWEPPIQLSPDTLYGAYGPSVVAQGDTIHITWVGSGMRYPYIRSVDGGKSFDSLRLLAPDSVGRVNGCRMVSGGKKLYAFFFASKNLQVFSPETFVMVSSNRGDSWSSPYKFSDSIYYQNASSALGDTVAIVANRRSDPYKRITSSTDGGISWRSSSTTISDGTGRSIALTRNTLHLVKGDGYDSSGIFSEFVVQYKKSTDLGETWSDSIALSTVVSTAYEPYISAEDNGDSSIVFAAWKDTKYGALTMVGCSQLGKISIDDGTTFEPEQRFDERPAGYETRTAIRDKILAIVWTDDIMPGDGGTRIRISTNGGQTWSPVCGLTSGIVPEVTITKDAVHVVWEERVNEHFMVFYRRGVFLPTSVSELEGVPASLELTQNYPNPFNPKTEISFKLQVSGFTSLKVYDLFGREAAILVNERMESGEHHVEWNAGNAASGVYYYRLSVYNPSTGIQTMTRKMILLK